MIPLADWSIRTGGTERRIELFRGDLSELPADHAVDILVVSAFPNDYVPTRGSLIGALHRRGISVGELSLAKERDLRNEYSCWISTPLVGVGNFRRILCVESGWRGAPPELADDLFRAIAACAISEFSPRSIAMPLLGAGDQGFAPEQMLESVVRAAVSWFRRGLPVEVIKIVVYSDAIAATVQKRFLELQQADPEYASALLGARPPAAAKSGGSCDVFLSYSHQDANAAERVHRALEAINPGIRVFFDKTSMGPGESWLMRIATSLDAARRVVVLHTPAYWASKYCKDEWSAAYIRQADTGDAILFPIMFRNTSIPYLFRSVQYADCCEADFVKLSAVCGEICASL